MAQKTISALNKEIENFLKKRGAIKVGFATTETLAGGPPSTDLTYVLPGARSAISFAFPLNREKVRNFIAKKTLEAHQIAEKDQLELREKMNKISQELVEWLGKKGFKAFPVKNNEVYRTEENDWRREMYPDISHRFIAAASGVGTFGMSGNIGIKDYGTAIFLGTVVTNAELAPTNRIIPGSEEDFCIKCNLCIAACPSRMFDGKEKTTITMGNEKFEYSRRIMKMRCNFVCGGFSGLHPSGKWSTWSPGRFDIPKEDKDFFPVTMHAISKYTRWPKRNPPGGFINPLLPGVTLRVTCGMCQKLCWGNKEETKKNYDLLINSGCILQKPNGEMVLLPPDEAKKMFDEFPLKHRKKYC